MKRDPLERKILEKKVSQCRKIERGIFQHLWGFSTSILSQNIKKLKGEKFYFQEKNLTVPKKTKKGDLLGFSNIHSDAKQQKKFKGDPLEKIFPDSLAVPKKIERGDPLVWPGMVCYAEKQEKPFWFSSLSQMMQFVAIIFCKTFNNYFGQFVWIKKVTIIVAFHFMKRLLKTSGDNRSATAKEKCR